MKAIVGVDGEHLYRPALRLLRKLAFPVDELVLAHCAEGPIITASPTDDSADQPNHGSDVGSQVLAEASIEARDIGSRTRTAMLTGSAASAMIELADKESADLIAVQSERKGAFRSFFFGSVSRGLAIASPCSLLISKGDNRSDGKLRAVFAVDHSPYSLASFEEFLRLRPKGIESVHVLSAVAMSDYMFWATHFDPYRSSEDREVALRDEFQRLNSALVGRLQTEGYEARGSSPVSSVNAAIEEAMKSADLLILGAQGHGFMERLMIGSNSLHQVIVEPHPVLLLRPRGPT